MRISEKGLAMIEKFEGCLLKASNKLDGVWTIGYGQTGRYYGKRVRRGMTTTKAEAHAWLRDHSIKTYEDAVTQAVKVPLNQNQFDALVSFTYNVGIGALKQSTAFPPIHALSPAYTTLSQLSCVHPSLPRSSTSPPWT